MDQPKGLRIASQAPFVMALRRLLAGRAFQFAFSSALEEGAATAVGFYSGRLQKMQLRTAISGLLFLCFEALEFVCVGRRILAIRQAMKGREDALSLDFGVCLGLSGGPLLYFRTIAGQGGLIALGFKGLPAQKKSDWDSNLD